MLYADELKNRLENQYDIPFSVRSGYENREPWVSVAPENKGKHLFIIKLSFSNEIRLLIDFIPQTFSAGAIRSMAKADEDKKRMFCNFASLAYNKKAKILLRINDVKYNPVDYKQWPIEWNDFEANMEIFPICIFPEKPDYKSLVLEWGTISMGMFLSLFDIVNTGENQNKGYIEGNKVQVLSSKYERNRFNRALCLENYGYKCQICDFDFEKTYGEMGKEFIHVHHIVPLSKMGESHIIDPIKDMIPVCPNCHSMLHRSDPPISPEVLKNIIKKNK